MTTETKLHQVLSLILHISRQGRALEGEVKREKKMGEIYKAPPVFTRWGMLIIGSGYRCRRWHGRFSL